MKRSRRPESSWSSLFQQLDGDEAIQLRIARQMQGSHAAGTEAALHFVPSDATGSHGTLVVGDV